MMEQDKIKKEILEKVKQYYQSKPSAKFIPGKSKVNYSGRVYDEKEMVNLVDSALEFWLTTGRYAAEFEQRFAKFIGVKYCALTNSGSSANLLAVSALTSPKLGKRALKKGDEIITVAAGFPTTIAPIIQNGCIPVFVDVELPSYNIDCAQLEKAISKKTKAVIVAHTLGNPFNVDKVKKICSKHDLWLIEDNCDSLGSKFKGKYTGTFGDIATCSFYPPHHLSCSKNTPIPYLDENGEWKLEVVENIYSKYVEMPEKIKVISFGKDNKVAWSTPSQILRHKLGQKIMVNIICEHGRSVEVTEDHSIFVLDKLSAEIVPKRADEINESDYIVATNNIPAPKKIGYLDVLGYFQDKNAYVSGFPKSNLENVKNSDYKWQYKSRNSLPIKHLTRFDQSKDKILVGILQSNKIPVRIPINKELCRLIGYFIAEGSYQNGLVFSFNKKERDLIEDVQFISKSLFNLRVSVIDAGPNAVNVEINSKNVEIVFREALNICRGARNKRIPRVLFHSDPDCIASFVYGYTRGDGSFRGRGDNTNHIDVTSVSKNLINDFQYLLSRIGISASFYVRNKAGERTIGKVKTFGNENYTLAFSGYSYKNKTIVKQNLKDRNNISNQIPLLDVFRNYISVGKGQSVISKSRLLNYIKKGPLYNLVGSKLSFLKVRKIKKIRYGANEYVYDFSVPGKENFYGGFLGMFLHNTMGEGGALLTNNAMLKKLIESFRDWGRDCWCPSGQDDTCKKRFKWQLGELPYGYDHKYVYSHFGYNLKVTDMQAAIGCAQLDKLPDFIKARINNYKILREALQKYSDKFIFSEALPESEPSWFGFLITLKPAAGFKREEIINFLEKSNIQTRMLFAGNMLRHPAFDEMRKSGEGYRVVGDLQNTDLIMNNTFWVGVYPGMTREKLSYIVERFSEFMDRRE